MAWAISQTHHARKSPRGISRRYRCFRETLRIPSPPLFCVRLNRHSRDAAAESRLWKAACLAEFLAPKTRIGGISVFYGCERSFAPRELKASKVESFRCCDFLRRFSAAAKPEEKTATLNAIHFLAATLKA